MFVADGLIGQLIALSNQLRAVTNEIRALEKKVGGDNADIQKLKLTFRTLTRSKQRIFYLVFQNNFLTNTTSDGNPFFTIAGRSV
ncbi:hypothetical protein A5N86_09340 [Geobacillus thermoleovorans]|nr:hypothetical protein A5N86_09340 [Geobacillus thermoleovorans]